MAILQYLRSIRSTVLDAVGSIDHFRRDEECITGISKDVVNSAYFVLLTAQIHITSQFQLVEGTPYGSRLDNNMRSTRGSIKFKLTVCFLYVV